MKEHIVRAIVLILVFFSYFAWRTNMTGFHATIILFAIVSAAALGITIKVYCTEPKNDTKRNQDRVVFFMIILLFLAAVITRILFLS